MPPITQPIRTGRPDAAARAGARDGLVFVDEGARLRLIGGIGRGAGWAGIVEVALDEEPLVDRAWRSGSLVRRASAEAMRIVGPYWAPHAAVVPLGNDFVVVFGGAEPLTESDVELVGAAAQLVAETKRVPAEKLLADELEVVQALRALTAYRPSTVSETARHIATVAARALSCDVAAVRVRARDRISTEVIRVADAGDPDADPRHGGPDVADFLDLAATQPGPLVEQSVGPDPRVWAHAVVSRLTLPIGTEERLGALSLGHAADRPRGFTMLCQRIGRAIAESAELLIDQAIATEHLSSERDQLRRSSETDALTGLGNRAAWADALDRAVIHHAAGGLSFAVLSADLDGLKETNDTYGHVTGDSLIRAAADVLRSSVRDGDTVARVGGDEFLVLLKGARSDDVRHILRRVRRNLANRRVSPHGLRPGLSLGWATYSGDAHATVCAADERMYRAKRRRARRASDTRA